MIVHITFSGGTSIKVLGLGENGELENFFFWGGSKKVSINVKFGLILTH